MKTIKKPSKKYLSKDSEWTFELLEKYDKAIAKIAKQFKLDTYPNQIEVITAEQMMDAYSAVGMPVGYYHWSFGKEFLNIEKNYRRGNMGLAYEIVINSNPCISYLMEENTMTMQALVIAHACYGHNSFFKGNYLFKTWTSPDSIIDYLIFAKTYITQCEQRYGVEAVELFLDSCHTLMNYGVDRYKRPSKISLLEEQKRQRERENYIQSQINDIWRTIPRPDDGFGDKPEEEHFPSEPQENLLYFFEKNAPLLEPWQREIIRIVRKIAQYFYPQRQTKVMNEGWATFWHYTLLNELYHQGRVHDGFMIEFLKSHTNVIYQPPFDSPHYSGINPYTLGFKMFSDIRRIAEHPTEEDRMGFPEVAGSDWIETLDFAMRNFKDESFVRQFLSPHLIRELKLFSILDDDQKSEIEVQAIHDEGGYQLIREMLAEQYHLSHQEPNIQVYNVNRKGDRSLILRHIQHNRRPLGTNTAEMLKHIHRLWGFNVHLESINEKGEVTQRYHCPEE